MILRNDDQLTWRLPTRTRTVGRLTSAHSQIADKQRPELKRRYSRWYTTNDVYFIRLRRSIAERKPRFTFTPHHNSRMTFDNEYSRCTSVYTINCTNQPRINHRSSISNRERERERDQRGVSQPLVINRYREKRTQIETRPSPPLLTNNCRKAQVYMLIFCGAAVLQHVHLAIMTWLVALLQAKSQGSLANAFPNGPQLLPTPPNWSFSSRPFIFRSKWTSYQLWRLCGMRWMKLFDTRYWGYLNFNNYQSGFLIRAHYWRIYYCEEMGKEFPYDLKK